MLSSTSLLMGLLATLNDFAQRYTGTVTTTDTQPVSFATVVVLNATLRATAVLDCPRLTAAYQGEFCALSVTYRAAYAGRYASPPGGTW